MVAEAGALLFGRWRTWNILFQERYKRLVTPYVLRPITVPPQPGCFEKAGKIIQTAHGYGSFGVEQMSGNAIERGA